MKKAFTILELVVAVSILAIVLSVSGVVFKVAIESHRTAVASAEIMQKLRAIVSQLNSDFQGLRKDAPLLMWFQRVNGHRFDQIMFFSGGDFQSTQLYNNVPGFPGGKIPSLTGEPIKGNTARIYYGLARSFDTEDKIIKSQPFHIKKPQDRILGRRQHILTADTSIYGWPVINPNLNPSINLGEYIYDSPAYFCNELFEHDSLSLAQWKSINLTAYDIILNTCIDYPPYIKKTDPNTFHNLLCEGVGSFSIQFSYWDPETTDPCDSLLRWFPGDYADTSGQDFSHFGLMQYAAGYDKFGVYFNIPHSSYSGGSFYPMEDGIVKYAPLATDVFSSDFFPKAIKFTFTLYDSKGVFKNGQTFTHIVYIGD